MCNAKPMVYVNEDLQQRLYEFYVTPPKAVSFEFFPPKDEAAEEALWAAVKALQPLNPAFVSVTYGAGGSTRARNHSADSRRNHAESSGASDLCGGITR